MLELLPAKSGHDDDIFSLFLEHARLEGRESLG
jgi:hypothetical protein